MEEFSDFITFIVKGVTVNVVCTNTDIGINTVAEIDNHYYYLGQVKPDVSAAISAWQYMSGKQLSNKEFNEVVRENSISDIDEQ